MLNPWLAGGSRRKTTTRLTAAAPNEDRPIAVNRPNASKRTRTNGSTHRATPMSTPLIRRFAGIARSDKKIESVTRLTAVPLTSTAKASGSVGELPRNARAGDTCDSTSAYASPSTNPAVPTASTETSTSVRGRSLCGRVLTSEMSRPSWEK